MREPERRAPSPPSVPVSETAAVVLDDTGVVVARTQGAARLLDCPPGQTCAPLLGLLPPSRHGNGTGSAPDDRSE